MSKDASIIPVIKLPSNGSCIKLATDENTHEQQGQQWGKSHVLLCFPSYYEGGESWLFFDFVDWLGSPLDVFAHFENSI